MAKTNFIYRSPLVFGVVWGLISAIAGGVIWGLIVNMTGFEIGFVALGIGLLSGFVVSTASQGSKGSLFQLIAVLSSILGIFIGQYYSYYVVLKDLAEEKFGTITAAKVSFFDPELFQIFLRGLGSLIGAYDLLWIGLAVYTSWRMLAK